MKLKDLIGIALASLFLFPVLLIGIMLAAGVVHIEFGSGKDKERLKEVITASDRLQQDEVEAKQFKAFKAAELKEEELKARQAEVAREMERLEALRVETLQAREEIARERSRIEDLVGKHAEVQDKQLAALAEVYGGMRPEEAAPILLSLEDALVVRILRKIPESRSTSKLMAALAALDVKRAARLTALLGGKGVTRTKSARQPKASEAPSQGQEGPTAPEPPKGPASESKSNGPQGKA